MKQFTVEAVGHLYCLYFALFLVEQLKTPRIRFKSLETNLGAFVK